MDAHSEPGPPEAPEGSGTPPEPPSEAVPTAPGAGTIPVVAAPPVPVATKAQSVLRLLAGLQTGILGGLLSLGWFLVLSMLYFQSAWALPNLLSLSIRNSAVWTDSFSWTTGIGVAVHLFACGLLGMGIGWVLPRPHPGMRTSIPGLIFGVILSLLVYEFFWKRLLPQLGNLIAPGMMFVVHGLFGASLAQFPRFFLALEAEPPAPPSEP